MDEFHSKKQFKELCQPNIKIVERIFKLELKDRIKLVVESLIDSNFFSYFDDNTCTIGPELYAECDMDLDYEKWFCAEIDEFVIPMIVLTLSDDALMDEVSTYDRTIEIKKGKIYFKGEVINRERLEELILNVEICDTDSNIINSFKEFKKQFNQYVKECV